MCIRDRHEHERRPIVEEVARSNATHAPKPEEQASDVQALEEPRIDGAIRFFGRRAFHVAIRSASICRWSRARVIRSDRSAALYQKALRGIAENTIGFMHIPEYFRGVRRRIAIRMAAQHTFAIGPLDLGSG